MRLIDADETIKDFNLNFGDVMDVVCAKRIINRQPTITPESLIKRGTWILRDKDTAVCNRCNRLTHYPGNYCPNCGRQME